MKLDSSLIKLIKTFKRLRDPETGCPWDNTQNFKSIASCSIEEAYEVADAIEREDYESLKSELGDLLFQIIFHSEMAAEAKLFSLDEVISELNDKLIRRHPHIFGNRKAHTSQESLEIWEDIKADERKNKKLESLMDDVPKNLPSLTRAKKLQKRAARIGFDWKTKEEVFKKLDEEIKELKIENKKNCKEGVMDELGDVIFTLVNLTRHYEIELEDIIRKSNLKFENRFRKMETEAAKGNIMIDKLNIKELQALWQKIK